MSRQEQRRITYSITVVGPRDEHNLETVVEWGLDGLIELFSQEGYTVTDHRPPIISTLAARSRKAKGPPFESLPPVPDSILRTGTKPPPARRQRPPRVPAPKR